MFSLEKFYSILHDNLMSKFVNSQTLYFYPFGTYDNYYLIKNKLDYSFFTDPYAMYTGSRVCCFFLDQEPLDEKTPIIGTRANIDYYTPIPAQRRLIMVANSEKSDFKDQSLKKMGYYNWYYFYHGFAALDWYRDFQYVRPDLFDNFNKVFISYNHLISKFRSYRLHLVSNLIEQDLVRHGYVSLFLKDKEGTWKDTIEDADCPLDNRARVTVYKALKELNEPLVIDTDTPDGTLSAQVDFDQLTSALWHIVTETVYFLPKLHLTEKVFKPIIAQRPFILVAAPGNLAYLRSYGFRTFDRWIDESYDQEQDHYVRIEKITAEIARLCALPMSELKLMHEEMKEVLQYNFNHFYGQFRNIITNELVDNFEGILMQFNNGREPNNHSRHHHRFDLSKDYLQEVKQRLLK